MPAMRRLATLIEASRVAALAEMARRPPRERDERAPKTGDARNRQ